ncbi:bZIP transcription factor family protein [Aphelenchoides avenae]|nr:bZIP transcription factor family protein [Aphelenchus avenae]
MTNLGFATPHGHGTRTTPGPMKKKPEKVPPERKDEAYKERRKKNNDSARRSREQRRKKEEETYQRCRFLEQQNALLVQQVNYLRLQLHSLMSNSPPGPYMVHNLPPWTAH